MEETMEDSNDTNVCVQSKRRKKFRFISNKKQSRKLHRERENYFKSLQLRDKKANEFYCNECHKCFKHSRNLRFHMRAHRKLSASNLPDSRRKSKKNKCALCSDFTGDRESVTNHYKLSHDVTIKQKQMSFETYEEFIAWKRSFETDTKSKFIRKSSGKYKAHMLISFICHRSGMYIPKGNNPKAQRSIKINALCPAKISVKKSNGGMCEINVIETHLGHENDIELLRERTVTCALCQHKFINTSSLRKHVRRVHPESEDYLESLRIRYRKEYRFSCNHCHKHFKHLRNLRLHIVKTHGESALNNVADNQHRSKRNKCALCNDFTGNKKCIINHYKQSHYIEIEENQMVFDTNEEFVTWKKSFERQTNSRFVRESSSTCKTYKFLRFICNRSGIFIRKENNLRRSKMRKSNKINAYCPAEIVVKKYNYGRCAVNMIQTHVGHPSDSDNSGEEGSKFVCVQCRQKFSNNSNLKKHVKKFHPESQDYLKSLHLRNQKEYKFTCSLCHKRFSHASNFRFHLKKHGGVVDSNLPESNYNNKRNNCALCSDFSGDRKSVINHYKLVHDIVIKENQMDFQTHEEFVMWKENYENQTNSRYVRDTVNNCKNHTYISFICHRSGMYKPTGNNLRHLKTQGSNKINALCPAKISVKKNSDGRCTAEIIETHVGHQNDVEHLTLTKYERDYLAAKIASKIPFEIILDEIRSSTADSGVKRLHLLTKKDLHNIEACYNLSSSSAKHSDDSINIDSWINEMRSQGNAVLLYKPHGSIVQGWPLKPEDFALIIMTAAQSEMLKMYGSDCICVDRTHRLNNYNFELITLIVVDDNRQGFPCAFLISNRSDKDILTIFYHHVKIQIGSVLCPSVFISDVTDSFYNAWLEVMSSPRVRLFSTWHVDRSWLEHLSKINSKEKQDLIYKNLRTLLEEQDVPTFDIMLNRLYGTLLEDLETVEFAHYLETCYIKNTQCWANCYRLRAGVNTNVNLEKMHKTLEHAYLKGKNAKRLDKAVTAIMRLVKDKSMDKLTLVNKRKLYSKLQLIRSRHKTSSNSKMALVVQCENGWNVASENMTESFFVQEVKADCNCELVCSDCKACLHKFTCSCTDSSVKGNMCTHIHLLCTYLNKTGTINPDEAPAVELSDTYENNWAIVEEPDDDDTDSLLKDLRGTSTTTTSFEEEKAKALKMLEELTHKIQSMTSQAELDVVKKSIAPINNTLSALQNTQRILLLNTGNWH